MILFLIILVAIGVWIYNDAKSRGDQQPGMWAVGAMLLAIIVVPVWLIKRPEKLDKATPSAAGRGRSAADEIKKLKALRDDGTLTEEEFQAKKKQYLHASAR